MAQIFRPRANAFARMILWGALVLLLALAVFGYSIVRSTYVTAVAVAPEQPVPFSHQHHVAGLGIDCRYCHTSVEQSSFAGLPPTETCMTCHSQIWTNAAMLAPIRQSLAADAPLRWTRVNDLPAFVYFNHSIHINKGIGCVTCHGQVNRMPLMQKAHSLDWGWGRDCHREPEKYVRPRGHVFEMDWQPPENQDELGKKLVQAYHIDTSGRITECYTCHR